MLLTDKVRARPLQGAVGRKIFIGSRVKSTAWESPEQGEEVAH